MENKVKHVKHVWILKPIIFTILAFLIPLNFVLNYSPDFENQSKCAYVIVVMAILWVTEAVPIPVTAMMPVFLFPMLGVVKASVISGVYFRDTTMLFLGGLIIAAALEESGLHIRISLYVMKLVGAHPLFLMAGLMGTTWFLSMWISNTAATSMMLPIIEAVMQNLEDAQEAEDEQASHMKTSTKGTDSTFITDSQSDGDIEQLGTGKALLETPVVMRVCSVNEHHDHMIMQENHELKRLSKAFALSVAYGANIGGIATLTGSPPNLVLKQQVDKLYEKYTGEESEISFANWMGFGFPLSVITGVLAWLWLALVFLRCGCFKKVDPRHKLAISATIKQHFKEIGKISFCEIQVLIVFIALVVLWLFRAPPNIQGWGTTGVFKKGYISDSTPCILLSIVLFLLPSEVPRIFCLEKDDEEPSYKPILDWKAVAEKLPWGVIVLLGGGFAIAQASEDSGLSAWVGNELKVFVSLDTWVMNLVICIVVAGATNVTSNTASATLLMPILAQLALQTQTHPLYLMMAAAVACSFAFMLPVATPPNAIVFSTGYLTIPDMLLVGLPINILAVMCLTLAVNTWGCSMFDLGTFPEIFSVNLTMT